MNNKEIFIKICKEKIKRDGLDKLLEWLEASDFYESPASTNYHGNYKGGLLQHSLNVYELLKESPYIANTKEETIAIVSLFHDLCKVNTYSSQTKKRPNESGKWVDTEVFVYKDDMPLGHGEKSVIILSRFLNLTLEEIMAINWHMGGFDSRVKGGDRGLNTAFETYPLALELHLADMRASYLIEREEKSDV